MKIRFKSNLWAGIVSILMGVVLMLLVPTQVSEELAKTASVVTSKTLPNMIAILFIVCGIILIIQSVILKQDSIKELDLSKELTVAGYMVTLVLYAIFFKKGFLICTTILAVVTLIFVKCKNIWYYLCSVGAVFALYFIFKTLLHVRLP